MSDDQPSGEDLAMAQAGQTAEALADLSRPSAEEQREADQETAEAFAVGTDALAADNISPTDIYSRVNTAHGAGAGAVLVQNPHTFSDDIARGNLPGNATDPHPDAQPTEPDTEGRSTGQPRTVTEQQLAEGEEGAEGQTAEGEEPPTGLNPNAPVYPNLAYGPAGTPEDLLYQETGLIATTVSNVDGVSMVEIDPEAGEIEAPVAGDAAPQTEPPEDKKTIDDTLTEGAPEVEHTGIEGLREDLAEGEEETEEEVEQVESDYDPGAHTVNEVNEYIAEHPEEAEAVYAAEEAGKARTGILG